MREEEEDLAAIGVELECAREAFEHVVTRRASAPLLEPRVPRDAHASARGNFLSAQSRRPTSTDDTGRRLEPSAAVAQEAAERGGRGVEGVSGHTCIRSRLLLRP